MTIKRLHPIRFLVLMIFLAGGCANPQTPPTKFAPPVFFGRRIVALRDRTFSFRPHLVEANLKIETIARALGPGDEFVLLDIGPDFDPARNVVVQCSMPALPPRLTEPASNLVEWNHKQAELKALWQVVENNRARILTYLHSTTPPHPGGTYLEAPLLYSARRLNAASQEKPGYLLVFSDVRTEKGTLKTSLPPTHPGIFTQIEVQIFMAPWNTEDWPAVESAWQNWFVGVGHAKSFRMYDTAESLALYPLPPNPAPHTLPSPFQVTPPGN